MGWRWNDGAKRYQDDETGRFLARDTVLGWVDQSIAASVNVGDTLSNLVANGYINVDDWQLAFREELKREYIRQYLSAIGGRAQMTFADWGSIGGMLREQYRYLDGFAQEIAAGNLSEAQIRARMAMYINSAREAHERAHGRVAKKWGADEVAWVLRPDAEHCDTCVRRSNMGWTVAGPGGGFLDPVDGEVWPADGSAECLTNDQCSLTYRNSETGEEFYG